MTEAPKHAVAAESQFASACLTDAAFARDFSDIAVKGLSNIKALDWLAPFCRDYVRKYGVAPAEDALPYAEAAVRACELPPEALAFFAQAAKQKVRSAGALTERARKHYHLLARQRHADRIQAACMSDDEDGISEADAELKSHRVGSEEWPDEESMTDKRGNAAMADSIPRPILHLPGYVGKVMNKALTRDAFVINVGTAKVGKTGNGVRVGYEAALSGLKAWYITLGDDKVPRIRRRVFACHSGRPVLTEADETQVVPFVCCKRGALGECNRCSGTRLSPFPSDKVIAEIEPAQLVAKHPDFVPCRDCWHRGEATHPDFEPMIWWMKDASTPMTVGEADDECDAMSSLFREGEFKVTYRPKGVLSYEKFCDLFDRRADKNGYEDDVIVLDYFEMMKLPPGRDDHEQLRTLAEMIRNFTTEKNLLLYSFLQANRLGGTIETHTMDTVGRCKCILDNCTAAFGINQTPLERAHGLTRIAPMVGREFKFAPEHQALCCSWLHVQDPFAESFHVYRKIKEIKER